MSSPLFNAPILLRQKPTKNESITTGGGRRHRDCRVTVASISKRRFTVGSSQVIKVVGLPGVNTEMPVALCWITVGGCFSAPLRATSLIYFIVQRHLILTVHYAARNVDAYVTLMEVSAGGQIRYACPGIDARAGFLFG